MIKMSKDEIRIIKQYDALPLSIIEKRIEEMKDELLDMKQEELELQRRIINEIKRWKRTIEIGKQETKKKVDNCV